MVTKFMNAREKKQHNREVYNNFIAQADTQIKEFVEMLMQFEVYRDEKANGFICVRVGERETEMFRFNLCSCTENPMIMLDSWESEPQISIRNTDCKIYNTVCMINLVLITNLVFTKKDNDKFTKGEATFTYGDVDYQIEICIDKEGV